MSNQFRLMANIHYPAMAKEASLTETGSVRNRLYLKNVEQKYFSTDAQTQVRPALQIILEWERKVFEETQLEEILKISKWGIVFLVTENRQDAKYAACLLSVAKHMSSSCYEAYDDDDEEVYEWVEPDDSLEEMHIFVVDIDSSSDAMKYGQEFLAKVSGQGYVYFDGLTPGKEKEQLDLIKACPVNLRFIRISKEQARLPEIRELTELAESQNPIFELEETTIDYYMQACKFLLKDSEATFQSEAQMREALLKMMRATGDGFSEEWIGHFLDKGLEGNHFNLRKMFMKNGKEDQEELSAEERLQKMPGMKNYKRIIRELKALALEESRNPNLRMHRNMIFMGNPGSGKTTAARMAAEIFASTGVTKPVFIMPARDKLIGKYVGQTAPKISEMFKAARGGVLFIDEAGFFLNEGSGGYIDEAIKEFVRYMELYPDVTVIFAMYASEVEAFLKLDDGLSSRISRIVKFEDYTTQELCEIAEYMFRENGYKVSAGKKLLKEFLEKERRKSGFGNARAVRKLVESVILSFCLERNSSKIASERVENEDYCISAKAVRLGIQRLEQEFASRRTSNIGFLGNLDNDYAGGKKHIVRVQEGYAE